MVYSKLRPDEGSCGVSGVLRSVLWSGPVQQLVRPLAERIVVVECTRLAQQRQREAGAEGVNRVTLIPLLKEAMTQQHGQESGKKHTVHLVQVMEQPKRRFFMFLCSNCSCDVCDKVRNLGYWSPVETLIVHYVMRRHGCQNGKALVVDVGAHMGYFSLIAASYGCRVASFEPNPTNLRYLNLSTKSACILKDFGSQLMSRRSTVV